jgi:glutaminyl-peptide cyclotransferase
MFRFLIIISIVTGLLVGCGGKKSKSEAGKAAENVVMVSSPNASKLVSPLKDQSFISGDLIEFIIESERAMEEIDSVSFFADGKRISGISDGLKFIWNSAVSKVGKIPLRVQVFYSDASFDLLQVIVTMKSDIQPILYTYEVVNSYPHDIRAYTQGLVYDGGYLYESTGQYGESSLRKVVPETGEVIKHILLERELFGEGLCIFEDRLYQITWKNKVGFVYEKESMRLLNRIYYQTEGWGLTTYGNKLIMSDGSHYIYFLDPLYFTETSRMEVYDDKGPVSNLNELELIDGYLYANIFGTDEIAIFSPLTGKVHGYINLAGILPSQFRHRNLDVLNGIAYDADNDRLFVTGKYWPRLFEIRIRPR